MRLLEKKKTLSLKELEEANTAYAKSIEEKLGSDFTLKRVQEKETTEIRRLALLQNEIIKSTDILNNLKSSIDKQKDDWLKERSFLEADWAVTLKDLEERRKIATEPLEARQNALNVKEVSLFQREAELKNRQDKCLVAERQNDLKNKDLGTLKVEFSKWEQRLNDRENDLNDSEKNLTDRWGKFYQREADFKKDSLLRKKDSLLRKDELDTRENEINRKLIENKSLMKIIDSERIRLDRERLHIESQQATLSAVVKELKTKGLWEKQV